MWKFCEEYIFSEFLRYKMTDGVGINKKNSWNVIYWAFFNVMWKKKTTKQIMTRISDIFLHLYNFYRHFFFLLILHHILYILVLTTYFYMPWMMNKENIKLLNIYLFFLTSVCLPFQTTEDANMRIIWVDIQYGRLNWNETPSISFLMQFIFYILIE